MEERGFKYDPKTFTDLFGTGWATTFGEANGDSSSEEEPEKRAENGFGEKLLTGEPKDASDVEEARSSSGEDRMPSEEEESE